jgi:molybdate transport system ATP-binding protein
MSGLRVRVDLARGPFSLSADCAAPGEGITALFGASGSGKTTLLRVVAGLHRAADARVAFNDAVWQDEAGGIFLPPHRRACGYVFQEASLFPHLSVEDNLRYGERRVPAKDRRFEFRRTVDLLGIGPLLSRRPLGLSGGERQRVAIARALLASPQLLLMDEPLASLDASRKGEILFYIEQLRDELRLPIVYVSHALDEVVRLADHVIVLEQGRVAAAGGVQETIGRVHGGSVIDVRVAEQDLAWGLTRLEFAGGQLFAADVDALPGERLRVRIAARDVGLSLSRPAESSFLNVLECTVAALREGAGASVDVELEAAGVALASRITRKSATLLGIAPGTRVFALIKAVAVDRRSVGYA